MPARLIVPVSQQDHMRGSSGAPVVLVEYGDYQCPYCGQAYWLVKNLEQRLGGLLGFVFRNFPLANVHSHAEMAAESAEAAATQEKFWAMHDCLFEQQQALKTRDLVEYAAAVGLDIPRFIRDMAERRYAFRVREDFLNGVRSGVNGTPTFFINGAHYRGALNLRSLVSAIEQVTRAA
jgi:protein-disulfide isomerase